MEDRQLLTGSLIAIVSGFVMTKLGQLLDLSYATVSLVLAVVVLVLVLIYARDDERLSGSDRHPAPRAR